MKPKFDAAFYKTILNWINSNIYITDIETDKIVYMNDYMKQTFHLQNPEGKICWQVLQEGMTKRCPFCRIEQLKTGQSDGNYIWKEKNTITGRNYINYDRLEEWCGRVYFIQNSVDITEQIQLSLEASVDELTGVLSRNSGKRQLEQLLKDMDNIDDITVALCDINSLKWVNDTYGHLEGDKLLVFVAQNMQKELYAPDFIFRLSGDEFILVFVNQGSMQATVWLQQMLETLEKRSADSGFSYQVSFSYGLACVHAGDQLSVSDVLSIADTQMYIQKRDYHIKLGQMRLQEERERKAAPLFQYNKDYLFDALSDSIDDYVFVGNLKTGTFIYSYQMMLDFALPGQIVDNAAAFWGEKIHPDDTLMFLRSNQEIADGRAENHAIVYRAKNANNTWTHLMCKGKMIRDEQGEPELFAGIIRNLDKQRNLYSEEGTSENKIVLSDQNTLKRSFYFINQTEEQEKLKTEMRLLRFVSRNIPGGVLAVYDKSRFPMYCFNQAILDYTQYSYDALIAATGGYFGNLIHKDDQQMVEAEIAQQLETKDLYEVRYRIVGHDENIIWVYERGRRAIDENGEHFILSFFVDISQKMAHGQELRSISECSLDGIFKIALQGGACILYANEGYYRIHGYTKEQIEEELQNQAQLLVYEKDYLCVKGRIEQSFLANERQVIVEYRIKKRDCSIAWVHMDACLIAQPDGTLVIIGMLMDITERKELEDKLRRTNQLFMIAKKQSNLTMWEFDIRNQKIILTDEIRSIYEADKILENVPESVIAQGVVHPESVAVLRKLYDQITEGKEKASAVVRIKAKDQTDGYGWQKITYTLMQEQGRQAIWAVGIAEDVTAQIEAERRVFEEESMQKLLTEDMLYRFRFNLSQNMLENLWTYVEGLDTRGLEKGDYTSIFQRILKSIVYEDDQKRFQSYYTLEQLNRYALCGEMVPDFEFRRRSSDGKIIWVALNMRIITSPENGELILLGYVKDIDIQKKRELALQKKAEIDEISGLYNYATAKLLAQELLQKEKEKNLPCALLLLDVDGFNEVNYTDSFLAGDAILKQIGDEIRKQIPASCIAGRVSGDVFLLFYHDMGTEQEIYLSAERTRQSLCREYRTKQYIGDLKVSGGIAYRFSEHFSFDQLYQCALYALETAKQNGKNQLLSYREVESMESETELEIMSNLDDYKIIAMNVIGQIAFGLESVSNSNLRCYELLHNREEPCPFCAKRKGNAGQMYAGEFFVPKLNRRMYVQERLALKDGRRVRQIRLRETPFEAGRKSENTALYQFLDECWDKVENGKERDGIFSTVLGYAKQLSQARNILFFEKGKDSASATMCLSGQTDKEIILDSSQLERTHYLEMALIDTYSDTGILIDHENSIGYQQMCGYYGGTDLPFPIVLIGIYEHDLLVGCLLAEQVQGGEDIIKSLEVIGEFLRRSDKVYQLWLNYNFVRYHDQKTGLLNYECYRNTLKETNGDVYSSFGMMGVHLVNLKEYNQNYGIRKGDKLLQFSANMLTEIFDAASCYRISGARFVVLCPDITYEHLLQKCNVLKERIKQSYPQWIVCEFVWAQHLPEIEKQRLQLEEKLQVAVNQKRNQCYEGIDQTAKGILADLQEKIQSGNFYTFLQPKAKTETGKICGAEALVRYSDKERGIVAPSHFLPEIERVGLIRYIDLFVLQDVCRIMQQWIAEGWQPFPISLNFSRTTILETGILEETNRIVEQYGLDKGLIEIEITETISSIDRVSLRAIANQFVETGYRLSVDDFGTDYSNIFILYSLNLSSLKLDRSVVSDIYYNNRARLVVENIVGCCKSMGINCVAEGVETAEQVKTLQQMGCDEIQGYYLNKPLPEEEFQRLYITKEIKQ